MAKEVATAACADYSLLGHHLKIFKFGSDDSLNLRYVHYLLTNFTKEEAMLIRFYCNTLFGDSITYLDVYMTNDLFGNGP